MLFVIKSSFLILSPVFFLFFSCAIANLFKCEMQTSFPGLFWLLSAHLRPFEILRGVPLHILSYLKI